MSRRGKRARKSATTPPASWVHGKRPILRFVLVFAVLFGVFQVVIATPWVKENLFQRNLRLNAHVSGAILGLFEESLSVNGTSIRSPRWSLRIERGCDAIDPVALFACALLAFPGAWSRKLAGFVMGTAALMVLNQVRIITLFYVGVYFPGAFQLMHMDVWQALFIFLALLFWVLWALWATPTGMRKTDVGTATA